VALVFLTSAVPFDANNSSQYSDEMFISIRKQGDKINNVTSNREITVFCSESVNSFHNTNILSNISWKQ
jgi:hypothetical protein